jgi:hypothetical protein
MCGRVVPRGPAAADGAAAVGPWRLKGSLPAEMQKRPGWPGRFIKAPGRVAPGSLMRPGAPLSPGLTMKTRYPLDWFTRPAELSFKIF